jgi:hypothetical protein
MRSVIGKINNRYVLYPITKIPCPPVCGQGFFLFRSFYHTFSFNLRLSKNPPMITTIKATVHDRKNPPQP